LIEPGRASDRFHRNCQDNEWSPVLLTGEEQYRTWLRGTPEEAFGLLRPFDPGRMQIAQSGLEKKYLAPEGQRAPGTHPESQRLVP
jgi:hypothetical protein